MFRLAFGRAAHQRRIDTLETLGVTPMMESSARARAVEPPLNMAQMLATNDTAVAKVQAALAYVPSHDRDTWVRVGMAVKAELGDAGFEVWDGWSRTADNYNEKDARSVWKSLKSDGKVTVATLIYEARRNGFNSATAPQAAAKVVTRVSQPDDHEPARRIAAAKRAQQIWDAATACISHPYLKLKGIKPHGVRVGRWEQRGWDAALLIPILQHDEDGVRVISLQAIAPTGEKDFLAGGQVAGGVFTLGQRTPRVLVGEGFATCASAHEATGHCALVTFAATHLKRVAELVQQGWPESQVVMLADKDSSGAGLKHATAAAQAVGGLIALPGDEKDFNDLAKAKGLEAVAGAIANATRASNIEVAPIREQVHAQHAKQSEWPEPAPLPAELPSVQAFDAALLPASLRPWIEDIAERVQCPPDYPAVGAIIALASVIGRKIAVRPKVRDDWYEVANLWGCIIGRPGVLKTPALQEAMRPLHRLEANARKTYESELQAWAQNAELTKIKREAARQRPEEGEEQQDRQRRGSGSSGAR